MKRNRTFYFKKIERIKNIKYGESFWDTSYDISMVKDSVLLQKTFDILQEIEGLKISDLKKYNFFEECSWCHSFITIKANKKDFHEFVAKFIAYFEDYIEDFKF